MPSPNYKDPLLLYSRILQLRDLSRFPLEMSATIRGDSLLVCLNNPTAFDRPLTHHQLLAAFNKIASTTTTANPNTESKSKIKFIRLIWQPRYIKHLYYIWHLDEHAGSQYGFQNEQPMLVLYDPQTMKPSERLIEHLNYGD